jgi:hypothetical protein
MRGIARAAEALCNGDFSEEAGVPFIKVRWCRLNR